MCIVDPDPAVCDTAVPRPSGRKKSCTDQSLLKYTAIVPGVHSSPGPARVFRAVFALVVQAGVWAAVSIPASSWSTINAFMDPGNSVRHGRVTYGWVRVYYARSLNVYCWMNDF
ncbi:hypothetical protein PoB_006585500 [Plakobranchus ocellatus]|uniref:Uncharacterized protein n=1 Tax=Plakobranchus ocellatus TaxID=259542 RepID=A0AAV4D5H5_9GAST|nr:hypothetical protein PoB_006585500 [Plakobranchus ocellatus]